MKAALISVIVPAFNAARFIGKAILSIQNQDYANLEIIVIDDASTDRTTEIAGGFDVTLIRHAQNQGAASARNTGIVQARGALMAFLDADDEWLPGKLATQVQTLQAHPHLIGVTGFLKVVSGSLEPAKVIAQFVPSFGTALFKREVFDLVGLPNPEFRLCDDVDWFNRVQESGQNLAVLPRVVLQCLRHDTNLSANPQLNNFWLMKVMQQRLRRMSKQKLDLKPVIQLEGMA